MFTAGVRNVTSCLIIGHLKNGRPEINPLSSYTRPELYELIEQQRLIIASLKRPVDLKEQLTKRRYIGDGVYTSFVNGMVKLDANQNEIYLEPEVFCRLIVWAIENHLLTQGELLKHLIDKANDQRVDT